MVLFFVLSFSTLFILLAFLFQSWMNGNKYKSEYLKIKKGVNFGKEFTNDGAV